VNLVEDQSKSLHPGQTSINIEFGREEGGD